MTRREQLGTDEFSLMDEENGRGQGRGSGKKKDDNNNGKETAPKKSKEANKTESEVKESAPKRAKRSKKDEAKGAEDTAPKKSKEANKTESEVKESAPKRAKRSKKDEAKGAEDTAPKKSKEANKTEPEVKESAPKRAKRSKKDEAKGAEDTAPKKSMVDEAEPNKSPDKKPADGNKRKSRKGQDKASTWAGRWIPSDPIALSKFQAIQSIFNECIAPKVRSQSSLQSPFFKVCNSAFKALSSTAKDEDYKACAKLQVEKFMADEQVRAWFRNLESNYFVSIQLMPKSWKTNS